MIGVDLERRDRVLRTLQLLFQPAERLGSDTDLSPGSRASRRFRSRLATIQELALNSPAPSALLLHPREPVHEHGEGRRFALGAGGDGHQETFAARGNGVAEGAGVTCR